MHTKTYQYMISSTKTTQLRAALADILRRDSEGIFQMAPTAQLLVASAELALMYLSGREQRALEASQENLSEAYARIKTLEADVKKHQRRADSYIGTEPKSNADNKLQADIEALTKRLDHLELATNHENFCADVRLRIIHEQFPGGVLHGIKK